MGCGVPHDASVLIVVIVVFVQLAQANWDDNSRPTIGSLSEHVAGIPVTVDIVSNIGRQGALLYNRESVSLININYSLNCTSSDTVYTIFATTSAEEVAKLVANYVFNISCAGLQLPNETRGERKENGADLLTHAHVDVNDEQPFEGSVTGQVNMTVEAKMIGRAFLILFARKLNGHASSKESGNGDEQWDNTSFYEHNGPSRDFTTTSSSARVNDAGKQSQGMPGVPPNIVGKALIIVMQLPRTLDEVFRITLYVVIVLATIGMGVKVDLVVIKQVLRRPIGPIIGLCCQYICMPLIAFLVAKLVPQNSASVSLGIFACGIVPGGGVSNIFTYLLGGDLSLSVTLTAMSNVASLALLPMWVFTLGNTFKDDTVELHVPYEKILEALAIVIFPSFLGIFIKYKLPRVANIIGKILKPVLTVIVAFTISFGIYINVYIFEMIRPMTIVAGCLLPYIGYLLGGFVAFVCFRTWTHIKTIAIETGIQNTSIAFLILYLSLPPPDNQLATVGPAASAIMTPLPLFVAVFLYMLYQRYVNKRSTQKNNLGETENDNGTIDMKEGKIVAKAIQRGEETAAIVIVWRKLTGRKPQIDVLEEMLNKEKEVMEQGK